MLRLLLVQPPHRDTFGYSMPPLGALRLGAVARAAGHAVAFVDLALLVRRGELPPGDDLAARAAERLLAEQPELVGLGAMVPSMPAALELAAELRARAPELPILLGGQGPEQVEHQVLARFPALDAIAVGEAETSFARLLAELAEVARAAARGDASGAAPASAARDGERPRAVPRASLDARRAALRAALRVSRAPGLVVADAPPGAPPRPRRNDPAPLLDPLDRAPSPAWDLAESPARYGAAAGGGETLFPLDLGRGCAFTCRFCTTSLFWERRVRSLSPPRAVDELERLLARPGLDVVYVTHDLFTADRAHVLALCAEIARRDLAFTWECRTRLDLVDRELLAALRGAGCRRILYGVESVAPARLAAMRKGGGSAGLDHAAVLERLGVAADEGVASILGLMVGLPGETRADVEANLALAAEACERVPGLSLSIHWSTPTPGNAAMWAESGAPEPLVFEPPYAADLVRGHDLPAGAPPPAQRAMVAADDEVFRAFRLHVPAHASAGELHRLTRHGHLLLELLPRSLRAAADVLGLSLADLLRELLTEAVARTPAERAASWSEPGVLTRAAAVDAVSELLHARLADASPCPSARRAADPAPRAAVRDLLRYEHALATTDAPRLLRLDHDPRAPFAPAPTALLLQRAGDAIRAARLPPLLADAFELDDAALAARHPSLTPADLRAARAALAERLADAPRAPRVAPVEETG